MTKSLKNISASMACLGLVAAGGCESLSALEAGGLVGSLTAAGCQVAGGGDACLAIGVLAGVTAAAIQNDRIGKQLSEQDNQARQEAILRDLDEGETVTYETEAGDIGTIEQTNAYRNDKGDECTSRLETITIGGVEEQVTHNLCTDKDGNVYAD